jgi:hypothetical protein
VATLVSRGLYLRLKSLNFVSGAQHCRTILLCIATWTGVKLCKKIVHGSLSLTWPWDFVPHTVPIATSAR